MSLGQLVLELKLNGNEFTVGLKSASGQLGQFVAGAQRANNVIQRAERSTSSWGHVIRDTVIGLALARDAVRTLTDLTFGWQKAIIGVNSDMERSIALMKNFSKQTDSAKATAEAVSDVNKLLTRASTSPFSLTAITDSFVKLRVGGVEPVFKSLDTLVDSVAAFGGSGENLKRAGVAIQQMAGKGVVSMEELRQQLGEAVPTAINAMAAGLGTTYSKLVKEISQGKVLSKPAIIAMMQQLELSFKGSAANLMNTWGGAVAQFETDAKKLAVAFGGLNDDGYSKDGYLKTVTNELKGLNEVMSDPEIINSARELGKTLAGMITSLANGVKWIIANRDAIYEWGKALLYLWAAYKGASIIGSVLSTAGAATQSLAMKMIQMRMAGQSVTGAMTGMLGSMSGWNSAAAIAAGGAVRIATGSNAAGTAVRMLGGALGVIAGPIGIAAALAISLGMAYFESKRGAEAARDAVLDLNGALTDYNQLTILGQARNDKRAEFDKKYGADSEKFLGYQTKEYIEQYNKEKAAAKADVDKTDADFLKARLNVAQSYGKREAEGVISANQQKIADISKAYKIDSADLYEQFDAESKKSGKKFDEIGYQNAIKQRGTLKIQDEIQEYVNSRNEAVKARDKLIADAPKSAKGNPIMDDGQLRQLEGAKAAISQFDDKIIDARLSMQELGKFNLASTLVEGAGAGKPAFDAMSMYVDGLRKSVAGLGAKVEEENPYLAQLDATIESLGGKKLPNFDAIYAEGKQLAEQRWAIEKAQKALTASNKEYVDGMERIDQIQNLVNNKLNKVENLNPWEKASADAMRYEDELTDLIVKMDEARQKAATAAGGMGEGQLEKLAEKAREAEKQVDDVRETIEKLKVVDTGKAMKTASDAINDALASNTEKAKLEYDRQSAWADEFYANHKDQLDKDAEAYAQYLEFRKSLDAQYQRETESGLESWIRRNKDATEQYKQLWNSAMDKFNDILVEGLTGGKMEFGDFVTYVLKEILRIQMAKALASAADAATGKGGWLSGLMGVASAFMGGGDTGGALSSASSSGASAGASNFGSQFDASSASVNFPTEFANGGIMTKYGQLALKEYANGGVANRPQVAIYGEGKKPEAYVPLPDGRTIPVTMAGGGGGGVNMPVNINIVMNSDGTSETEGSSDTLMNDLAGKIKVVCMEVLMKETRPGGIIDKRK